jgi:hypothetical protein
MAHFLPPEAHPQPFRLLPFDRRLGHFNTNSYFVLARHPEEKINWSEEKK